MSHALQVRFRKLVPSESLISLAAERYRKIRQMLRGPGECLVSIETRDDRKRPVTEVAVVLVFEDGPVVVEASACHKSPRIALSLAFADVESQLGRGRLRALSA